MNKLELTDSSIDRQNILNNKFALEKIEMQIGIKGLFFENEYKFTIQQLQEFYGVDKRTIQRYIEQNEKELKQNGYNILKGNQLKEFKKEFNDILVEGAKAPQLGVFNFRGFLNIGMLLVESEKAKLLRSTVLDIVIDTLNNKLGGNTKYINQRDEDFLISIIREPIYRKEFTSALNNYVEMGNFKYALFTDRIYQSIFKENSKEYKAILNLDKEANVRDTMYSEVLSIIASFENGLAHEMELQFKTLNRKLSPIEMENLVEKFANHPLYKPLIESACIKMASRDYGLRKVLHEKLKAYVKSIPQSDFERFLGAQSKSLEERFNENKDVFLRLKDR